MQEDTQVGTGLYRPSVGNLDVQVTTGIYRTEGVDGSTSEALGLDDPNSPLSLALASITLNADRITDGVLVDTDNNIALDVENLPALP